MIYTLTLNPSIDYVVKVVNFKFGKTNRTQGEEVHLGGKGLNVSSVLNNLGIDSIALGFVAGFTGDELIKRCIKTGISNDFIRLYKGMTRINVKFSNYEGTEINAEGPEIDEGAVKRLMSKLEGIKAGDTLILAGSIPKGVSETIYSDIMELLNDKGVKFVVDTAGSKLTDCLKYHPFLVKPNNHELGEIFGVKLTSKQDIIPYAIKLKEMGADNVLVSMAGKGAVLVDSDGTVHEMSAPKGQVINAVGAGDSMVAGFIAGYMQSGDYKEALRLGVAAGSASTFLSGLASKQDIMAVLNRI